MQLQNEIIINGIYINVDVTPTHTIKYLNMNTLQ